MRARVVHLRPELPKTAAGQVLPLEGPLWNLFKRRWEGRDLRWVFHRDGKPVGDFRKVWRSACTTAGIQRIPHDFRRTAARDMVRASMPERVAMELTGHKTQSIFDRYNIVNDEDLRDAMRKTHTFRTSRTVAGIRAWHIALSG